MAMLKAKDAAKLGAQERVTKLSELRLALMKGSVRAQRANAKTKEIKKAIARLLTFSGHHHEGVAHK